MESLPEFGCSGKVAIVTGGGRGIGRSIALGLAEAGADVVVTGRTLEKLNEITREITGMGRRGLSVPADISIPEQVESLVSQTIAEMGKIDILVCNAGAILHKPVVPLPGATSFKTDTPISDDEWYTIMNTNLSGAFFSIRAVGPHMIKQNYGKIIIISSVLAIRGGSYIVPYAASKGGLTALVKSLSHEWARHKINVNAIAPGITATEMAQGELEDKTLAEKNLRLIPLRRAAQPREIALATVYLASPASDYMTGQTLSLDGGSSA